MHIDEFIERLQEIRSEHPDMLVQDEYGNEVVSPEFNDDDGAVVVITFWED